MKNLTLTERPRLRLFTLCALYVAQGIPWGFVYFTLKAWLAEAGLSADSIGELLFLAGVPWAIKPLWGPVIDGLGPTSYGRRRPWIVAAQLGMLATLLGMVAIPNLTTDLRILGWMIFTHNVFNSLQDVAVDALAVDMLSDDERGRANGLMYGSKWGGGAIGGAGMAVVAGFAGLKGALLLQVGMLSVIMVLPVMLIERPGERRFPRDPRPASIPAGIDRAEAIARGKDTLASLVRAFSLRSTIAGGVLAFLVRIPGGVLGPIMAVFFLQHLEWSKETYATIDGGPVLVAGLVGSVAGGFVADALGRRRTAAFAMTCTAALYFAFAWAEPHWGSKGLVVTFMLLEAGLGGLLSVALFALFMDISWPKVAATQFTTYMALLGFSASTGAKLAGRVEAWGLSYPELFMVAGVCPLVIMGLLLLVDPGETRRVLGSEPS